MSWDIPCRRHPLFPPCLQTFFGNSPFHSPTVLGSMWSSFSITNDFIGGEHLTQSDQSDFFLPGIWSWDIGTKSVRWYWARELKSHVELGPQVVALETHSSRSYRGDKEEDLMVMLMMFWSPIAVWQASPKLSGLQQLIATSCGPVGWLDLVRWFSLGVSHAILIRVWLGLVSSESSAGLGVQDGASTG